MDLSLGRVLWTRQLNSRDSSTQVTGATLEVDEVPRGEEISKKERATVGALRNANHEAEETEIIQPGGDGNHGSRKAPGQQANSREVGRGHRTFVAVGHNTKDVRPRRERSQRKEESGARPCGWQRMWVERVLRAGHHRNSTCFREKRG